MRSGNTSRRRVVHPMTVPPLRRCRTHAIKESLGKNAKISPEEVHAMEVPLFVVSEAHNACVDVESSFQACIHSKEKH